MQIKHRAVAIRTEPTGEVFFRLLDFAAQHCKLFSLNWIEGGPLAIKRVIAIDRKLHPYLASEDQRRWAKFEEYTSLYHTTPQAIEVLKQAPSLYLWNDELGTPQDLSFYTELGTHWLLSDSHNHEAYIFTQPISLDLVLTSNPGLDLVTDKPVIVIDGANFNSLEEFAKEASAKMFPQLTFEWMGNLDSFNDLLCGGYGTPPHGFVLVWHNSERSREVLGYSETVQQLQKQKEHCHSSHIPRLEEEIKQAEAHKGATVFDWLIEVLDAHAIIDVLLE